MGFSLLGNYFPYYGIAFFTSLCSRKAACKFYTTTGAGWYDYTSHSLNFPFIILLLRLQKKDVKKIKPDDMPGLF